MDNYEEYILRVLHRTSSGLQDSLIPAHGAILKKIVEQFEQTPSIVAEIQALMSVHGFSKVALALEWLTERILRSEEDFSPEQFESDVLLLNEKIFEAFLNQPFAMPDYGTAGAGGTDFRSVRNDVTVSEDEFMGTSYEAQTLSRPEIFDPAEENEQPALNDVQQREHGVTVDPFTSLEDSLMNADLDSGNEISSPPLYDIMDTELLEITERIAGNAVELFDKPANERIVAATVLRVNARAGLDLAKISTNLIVQDFFSALVKFINTADELGKIKSDAFAEAFRDIGDRLSIAFGQSGNGITVLQNIIQFINDPNEILGKKRI
jgi:hypothetical protein